MCRRGAWTELTVKVTSLEEDSKQDARIFIYRKTVCAACGGMSGHGNGNVHVKEGDQMENQVQITINSMNSLSGGDVLYEKGDAVTSIGLLVKGRVEAVSDGMCVVLGSGNFLGICDVEKGNHTFTYTAKDDVTVYVLAVKGLESVERLLKVKPEYCGLLVTSLNFLTVELLKRLTQFKKENDSLNEFMDKKYLLCEETAKSNGVEINTAISRQKLEKYSQGTVELADKTEYYRQCASIPIEVQKKYFGGSAYIAFSHYCEQCQVIDSLVKACGTYGEHLYRHFMGLVLDEDSLFQTVAKLALSLADKGSKNALVDNAVDEIVAKINDTEVFLIEKVGMEINLDRERMEKLYFALLSGEAVSGEEMEELDTPGIEVLYNALEQIMDYAPVHVKVKSEFKENIELFEKLSDKFDKAPERMKLRKQITSGFFEIYEAVVRKSFDDKSLPLAVKLFLDFGFVSEKLLTEAELQELVALRPVKYSGEGGCRVYTMRKWMKAVYDGVKLTSKNEFDLDYEGHLRELVKEKKLDKKDIPQEMADKEKRFEFECKNMLRYGDKIISGNISSFVPVLCSDGIYNKITNSYLTEEKINAAVQKVEEVDYSVFYRDRLVTYEKPEGVKATVLERIPPDVILFPVYGKNCQMWQDIEGKKRSSKGRIFMPALFEKELEPEIVRLLSAFRWEKCRTDMGSRWNDFLTPSLTSAYCDYLQFYRKNSELSMEGKQKVRAQLQQCNNKYKVVFSKDYADWILRESRGAMKLSRVARTILFTFCPFSNAVYKAIEGQTAYAEAAKKYLTENRAAIRNIELIIHKFDKDGIDIPEELKKTAEYLKG